MSDARFKVGDVVYVAYLRINEDEVDWNVIQTIIRGYRTDLDKPVVRGEKQGGEVVTAYEEDCFPSEVEAIDRVLARIHEHSKRMFKEIIAALDERCCHTNQGQPS